MTELRPRTFDYRRLPAGSQPRQIANAGHSSSSLTPWYFRREPDGDDAVQRGVIEVILTVLAATVQVPRGPTTPVTWRPTPIGASPTCAWYWRVLGDVEGCSWRATSTRRTETAGRIGRPTARRLARVEEQRVTVQADCWCGTNRTLRRLQNHRSAFQSCYEWEGLVDDPELETTLLVTFQLVERSLVPDRVRVTAARRATPGMVRCVLRVVRALRFPRYDDARCDPRPVWIRYPLHFFRRAEARPGRSSIRK